MNLLPTFGFKGTILPIIDKSDRIYFFIKNELEYRVLLNIVGVDVNKFLNVESKSNKLIQIGFYKTDAYFKIFYMGQELFDFSCNDLDKNTFLLYSNYIIKNNMDVDRITFSPSFQSGLELTTLSNKPQNLFIQIIDRNSNEIIHEDNFISGGEPYVFNRNYFINYGILVLNSIGKKIYQYDLDLKGQKIWIKFESKALGDSIAWIPYVEEFRKKYECEVLCTTHWNNLFINQYPYIKFVNSQEIVESKTIFAIYKICCSIPHILSESPVDYREVGIQEIASKSLGLEHKEIRPKVLNDDSPSQISENYVVISTMSSAKAKLWNNENGWQEIINYLNSKGFKVVLLQKEKEKKYQNVINKSGTENIHKTVNIIKNCKFFIGLSSGLSWLAWALNKEVILISGFTHPHVEFQENCSRIIDTTVCHGCWGDKNYWFDRTDWLWCPRKNNFECSRKITSQTVIKKIEELTNQKDI